MADERDALVAPMEPLVSADDRLRSRLDAIGVKFITRSQEPTYRCHVCRDTGYTSHEKADKFGDVCTMASPCEGSTERPCPFGIPVEAGLWARDLNPRRGDSVPPPDIADRYKQRLQEHPHGLALRDAVDRALAKTEKA